MLIANTSFFTLLLPPAPNQLLSDNSPRADPARARTMIFLHITPPHFAPVEPSPHTETPSMPGLPTHFKPRAAAMCGEFSYCETGALASYVPIICLMLSSTQLQARAGGCEGHEFCEGGGRFVEEVCRARLGSSM